MTQCLPRCRISQSGILPALANSLIPQTLTPIHVEFLQACIYAEQYRYAERWIADTWPRPVSPSVQNVLRYFYLRGSIHMACANYANAIRCFWTCLSVPADTPSQIAVAAFKKLVLVQCLVSEDCLDINESALLALPKAVPTCVSRFVGSATIWPRASQSPPPQQQQLLPPMQLMEAPEQQQPPPEEVHMVESSSAPAAEGEPTSEGTAPRKGPADLLKVYVQLVRAFAAVDRNGFDAVLREHEEVLRADGNLGWAYQCQTALIRRHIYQMSSIYSTVPLQRLAELLSLDESRVQRLLLQLSMDRAWPIAFRTDQGTTFVVFPPRLQETTAVDSEQLLQLAYLMRNLDVSVASSGKYLSLAKNKEQSKKNWEETRVSGPRSALEDDL